MSGRGCAYRAVFGKDRHTWGLACARTTCLSRHATAYRRRPYLFVTPSPLSSLCAFQQMLAVCAAAGDVYKAYASSTRRHAIWRSCVPPSGEQEHLVHRVHRRHVYHHYGGCRPRLARFFLHGAEYSIKRLITAAVDDLPSTRAQDNTTTVSDEDEKHEPRSPLPVVLPSIMA